MSKMPYKFNGSTIEKTNEYLSSTGSENKTIPTVEGLALHLGVNDDTLNEWSKKHKSFKRVFNKLKMMQKVQLINVGMYSKDINPNMFIFLLKANHGLSEVSKVDVTTNGKDLPLPITSISTDVKK